MFYIASLLAMTINSVDMGVSPLIPKDACLIAQAVGGIQSVVVILFLILDPLIYPQAASHFRDRKHTAE